MASDEWLTLPVTRPTFVCCLGVYDGSDKIFKMYLKVNPWYEQSLGATGGSKLRSIIFILIESGMVMFATQMVRVVLTIIELTDPASQNTSNWLNLIVSLNQMLYGITPTIILVRVSMGLSYYDQKSMEETTASLRFASDNPNSNLAGGSTGIMGQASIGDDIIGVQRLSEDIPTISSW